LGQIKYFEEPEHFFFVIKIMQILSKNQKGYLFLALNFNWMGNIIKHLTIG
jgi:hypothetical protein